MKYIMLTIVFFSLQPYVNQELNEDFIGFHETDTPEIRYFTVSE